MEGGRLYSGLDGAELAGWVGFIREKFRVCNAWIAFVLLGVAVAEEAIWKKALERGESVWVERTGRLVISLELWRSVVPIIMTVAYGS